MGILRRTEGEPCDVTADLLTQARAGDQEAFRQLVEPYRHHLQLHCYRILGSVHDAEDALQETLLSAWQGLSGFEERASVRTWLYRVATNCCLKVQRSRRRSQSMGRPAPWPDLSELTRFGEVLWLEPYPDILLDQLTDTAPGPEARFDAREVAQLLDSTEESVTSALKRARATLERRLPKSGEREQPPALGSATEQ